MAPHCAGDDEAWVVVACCAAATKYTLDNSEKLSIAPLSSSIEASVSAGDRIVWGGLDTKRPVATYRCQTSQELEARGTAGIPDVPCGATQHRFPEGGFSLACYETGIVPQYIWQENALNEAVANGLPSTHDFGVQRTVRRLRRCGAKHVGLQFPACLQSWATTLADILLRFVDSLQTTTILGDSVCGPCCIDDSPGRAAGIDCLVQYVHSSIGLTDHPATIIHVPVDVRIDSSHLIETVRLNFSPQHQLIFMASAQFTSATQEVVDELAREFHADETRVHEVTPLCFGGAPGCCTAPLAPDDTDAIVFVCDGLFHLEIPVITNLHVKGGFFRYDPWSQKFTREEFDSGELLASRRIAIDRAAHAKCVGLIAGTVDRKGPMQVLEEMGQLLDKQRIQHFTLLLSDMSPERLMLFTSVDAWVQVACPRMPPHLADAFSKPLLTIHEAHIVFAKRAHRTMHTMWANLGMQHGHGGGYAKEKQCHACNQSKVIVEYEDEGSLRLAP